VAFAATDKVSLLECTDFLHRSVHHWRVCVYAKHWYTERHMSTKIIIIAVLCGVVLAAGWLVVASKEHNAEETAQLETLATCLTEKGAVFYGAFWCSHCQAQKAAFGGAADSLPYVECASLEQGVDQTPACAAAEITSYPTWIFADGERLSGERPLAELAEKTGCEYIPGE